MADITGVQVRRAARIVPVLCGTLALTGIAQGVQARGVEQHPAPVLVGPQVTSISAPALETRLTDSTPFGVPVAGFIVVDSHANGTQARGKTGAGINTSLAGQTAQSADFRALLQKYVGQPLSYRLIGQVEADVTKYYREHGRSLVQVTVPPQEITSGVLQLNVNTFVLEQTVVQGGKGTGDSYITSQIRTRPGQEVNTASLLDDVNWLNLNPFRHVSVVFEPGAAADSTRLTLQVQNGRPWSAYAGLSNSGTKDTGLMRLYAGFNVSALAWQDQQLSFQFNIAPETLSQGNLWDAGLSKGYVTQAVSYFVPLTFANGFRMKATLGASHISSYSDSGGIFTDATTTNGVTGELSFPLPRTAGTWTLVPELFLGAAANSYDRTLYGFGNAISEETSWISHLELGLRSALNGNIFGSGSHGNFEISLLTGRVSTDVQTNPFPTVSGSANFNYMKASINQEVTLADGHSVALRFAGQYSPDYLPSIEQLSLGGDGTVRGYPSSTVSSQSAGSFTMEYRTKPISIPFGAATGRLRPHVFADAGMADKTLTTPTEYLASVGLGADLAVGENLVAKLDIAHALDTAGETLAGTTSVSFQLTARF